MKKALNLLGFDFGASSGRAMLGTLEDGKLTIREIHRFPQRTRDALRPLRVGTYRACSTR